MPRSSVERRTLCLGSAPCNGDGYHGNVTAFVKEGVTDENRAKVLTTIKKHVQTIESLREKLA